MSYQAFTHLIVAVLFAAVTLQFPGAAAGEEAQNSWLDGDPGEGIRVVSSPDGAFSLRVLGQLQPQLVFFDGGSDTDLGALVAGDPDDREGFKLRRARFGLSGKLGNAVGYKLLVGRDARYDELDWTVKPETEGLAILDAYIEWVSTPYIQVRGGAHKVPFGGQALQSSAGLQLIERAVAAENIGPGRDVGLRLHGTIAGPQNVFAPEGISWWVGAYSGDGTVMTPDDNMGLLWSGRVAVSFGESMGWSESCMRDCGFGLRIGGGGGMNFERESVDQYVGGDVTLKLWRLSLRGEYMRAQRTANYTGVEVPAFPEQFKRTGYLTQIGFMIVPRTLEVAFRHDFYDDDLEDVGDYSAVRTFTGGANVFFLDGRAKLQVNYIHRFEPGSDALSNDTVMAQGTLVL